jgi:hypothetical protein
LSPIIFVPRLKKVSDIVTNRPPPSRFTPHGKETAPIQLTPLPGVDLATISALHGTCIFYMWSLDNYCQRSAREGEGEGREEEGMWNDTA